jgi:hypothetical protein
MHPVTSIHQSSASTPRDLCNDVTCITRSRASTILEVRLENPSPTCFHVKQAARFRRVSHAVLLLSVLWRNWQTIIHLVLRSKLRHRHGDFDAQITKAELSILRPKPRNQTILVLRLNQETNAPHHLVHLSSHKSESNKKTHCTYELHSL